MRSATSVGLLPSAPCCLAALLAARRPAAVLPHCLTVLLPRSTVPNLTCKLEHRQNHPGLRARRGHGPASSETRRELRADDMPAAVHVSPRRRPRAAYPTLQAAARRASSFPPRHLAGRSTPTPSRGPLPRNSAVSDSRSCRPAPPACRAGGPASPRRAE